MTIIDSKIYLLHQTAKEFLVQRMRRDSDSVISNETGFLHWKSSLRTTECHRILAEVCMWRLLWKDIAVSTADVAADSKECVHNQVLLDYSAQNWVTHFRNAQMDDNCAMVSMASALSHQDPSTPLSWFKSYWRIKRPSEGMVYPTGLNVLIIASFCGLECVARLLLKLDGLDLNSRDHRYNATALAWAAQYGHETLSVGRRCRSLPSRVMRSSSKCSLKPARLLQMPKVVMAGHHYRMLPQAGTSGLLSYCWSRATSIRIPRIVTTARHFFGQHGTVESPWSKCCSRHTGLKPTMRMIVAGHRFQLLPGMDMWKSSSLFSAQGKSTQIPKIREDGLQYGMLSVEGMTASFGCSDRKDLNSSWNSLDLNCSMYSDACLLVIARLLRRQG